MKNASHIIDDSIKATLFGKFYEKILLRWLKEKKGFTPFDGKPRVYWRDVDFHMKNTKLALKLGDALRKYKSEKRFCTPDGFLQKDGKFYIWEAKNWPMWTEGKEALAQLTDLLCSMPLILSAKAVYRTKEYMLDGVLFSWWSRPDGVDALVKEINRLISPRSFQIFYTSEVLGDCIGNKYPWYLEIIEKEKTRIDKLFADLGGQS